MMPDPAFYAKCLQESFEELKKGAMSPKPKKKKTVRRKAAKKA
jgi:hypothetical protein